MQAALGLPGDPGPWAGQLKGKILGLGPLRPPGTLPLPTPRPPHTSLPPSPLGGEGGLVVLAGTLLCSKARKEVGEAPCQLRSWGPQAAL